MRPARCMPWRSLALGWLLAVATPTGIGCDGGAADLATSPPPAAEALPGMARTQAQRLGRVNCSACPDHWAPRACDFIDEVRRNADPVEAATCAVVAPPSSSPGLPEGLPSQLAQAVRRGSDSISSSRQARADRALRLYAFGADAQRLGTIETWRIGQQARAEALAILAKEPARGTWPRDLLAIDAAGPAPARVAEVAVLELLVVLRDPGWKERKALGDGLAAARAVIRAPTGQQAAAMRTVAETLQPAWTARGVPAADLVAEWEAAERLSQRTVAVALAAVLSGKRACPASLDALVPGEISAVPEGWQLDPETCTPLAPARPQQLAADLPAAGGEVGNGGVAR